ncbi:MAG: hypothetical protein DHS20C18_04550 [Saprospiraceae bacterium]|nr:MAG: hypothetical protein DHS20C18_04550 [Saprospiraceae bacterium]
MLLFIHGCLPNEPIPESVETIKIAPNQDQVSLTFILGEDGENGNQFYKRANYYYQMHPTDKTDYVVYQCRSLQEVKDYLESFSQPLSLINLVSHGNPWQGLSVPILKDGERSSYTNLKLAFDRQLISPVRTPALTAETRVNIVSCGVGQDEKLVGQLERFFEFHSGDHPVVIASEHYINFGEKLKKYTSKYYFVTSKYEYADQTMIPNRLTGKYREAGIDWSEAYTKSAEDNPGSAYRYHFRMAVNWTVLFDNKREIDKIQSESDLVHWMKSQEKLNNALEEMDLTFQDFHWAYFQAGTDKDVALKIRGFCNVDGIMVNVAERNQTCF